MIVDTIFMLAQSASAATAESSEINKYLLSALISAGVALLVTCLSIFVQIKNTNKSIKAAAENLEKTFTNQRNLEEAKREHELELKNRELKLKKIEEFYDLLSEADNYVNSYEKLTSKDIKNRQFNHSSVPHFVTQMQLLNKLYLNAELTSDLEKIHFYFGYQFPTTISVVEYLLGFHNEFNLEFDHINSIYRDKIYNIKYPIADYFDTEELLSTSARHISKNYVEDKFIAAVVDDGPPAFKYIFNSEISQCRNIITAVRNTLIKYVNPDFKEETKGSQLIQNILFGPTLDNDSISILDNIKKAEIIYTSDFDDLSWNFCEFDERILPGDILEASQGFYHVVTSLQLYHEYYFAVNKDDCVVIELSKSCHTPEEAVLVATQMGVWPPKDAEVLLPNEPRKIHPFGSVRPIDSID